jgi:acetyl esterase
VTGTALDPEMAAAMAAMADADAPSIQSGDVDAMRAVLSAISPRGGPAMARIEDGFLAGVAVRSYWSAADVRGRILLFHGGGWVLGSVEDYDHFSRTLADATGCQVVSADYRLAPEHPFPAAVEDAWAVVRSVQGEGPLFVAGDSAGGNLSAVVAQLARDAGGPAIAGQILIYPSVAGDAASGAMRRFVPPMLTRGEIAAYYDLYLPEEADRSDVRFAPLRGRLEELPSALIVAAGADLFADEARRYAAALEEAGVPAFLHDVPGAPHAFLTLFPDTRAARGTIAAIAGFVTACIDAAAPSRSPARRD